MDLMVLVSDLLRVSLVVLFTMSTYYVRDLAREVREIRRQVGDHAERISRIEGARGV